MGLTGLGDRLTGTSESLLLCRDGKEGVVFCGIPDWVYEGEGEVGPQSTQSSNGCFLAYIPS